MNTKYSISRVAIYVAKSENTSFGVLEWNTVNPLYTDTRYNDKIRYNDFAQEVTFNEKICKNTALKLQAIYVLDVW